MSSKENNTDSPKNQPSKDTNKNSINFVQSINTEENPDCNELVKPIPINLKLIKNQNSELTTLGNSGVTMANLTPESNIPIIYHQIQFPGRPQPNIYQEEKNQIFQPKKFKSKEIIENNNLLSKKDKPCCSCTKTKCIKKYCECYSNKRYCSDCHCQDCMNKFSSLNSNNSNDIKYISDNEIIICTCTKSGCNKKYCECYKAGKKCNDKCRCLNCLNTSNILSNSENNDNNSNKKNKSNDEEVNNNINDIKSISRKSSLSDSSNNHFKIQRISVFINKNQTLINVEKFSKEDMNLLSRKRSNCNKHKSNKK